MAIIEIIEDINTEWKYQLEKIQNSHYGNRKKSQLRKACNEYHAEWIHRAASKHFNLA